MSILTRKRRHSDAFHEEAEPQQGEQQDVEDGVDDGGDAGEGSEIAEGGNVSDDPERARKEREVWDAYREEQYEVLEQLPLSLHRSFALILELDQQEQENKEKLVPTLRDYISVRKKLAEAKEAEEASSVTAEHTGERQMPSPDTQMDIQMDETGLSAEGNQQEAPEGNQQEASTASSLPDAASSRELLTKVANLSDEMVRACNEKVNVARFAYDLVDRYIRDLDRAIKEQETSLSLGLRPGTHPASIILPEIVPPTTARASRVSQLHPPEPARPKEATPAPVVRPEPTPISQQFEEQEADEDEPMLGIESNEPAEHNGGRTILIRPRRRRSVKWSKKKKATPVADAGKGEASTPEGTASLKLTVPPLSAIIGQAGSMPSGSTDVGALGDMPIDPNEPLYCYCNQVSFGVMIACDNPTCEREWFHLGCAGLNDAPSSKAKWYCRDCAEMMGHKKKAKS